MTQDHPEEKPIARDVANDRRKRPTPALSWYTFFGGRRRGERRAEIGDEGKYVDVFPPRVLAVVLTLYTLNLLDAIFTLFQIRDGATEMNPLADWVLGFGPTTFILVKCIVMAVVLAFLCIHKNFGLGRKVLAMGVLIYALLCVYHIVTYFFRELFF